MCQLNIFLLLVSGGVLFLFSNPISLLMCLLALSLGYSVIVGLNSGVLPGFIFFLVFVGGILILIFYVVCLFSNFKAGSLSAGGFLSICLCGVLFGSPVFSLPVVNVGVLSSSLFYGGSLLGLFFSFYFIACLWLVLKFNIFNSGSLRPWY
uniref:NADH dehydrogenase subunit 6 n=1 Tax=Syndesmis echinorum TaxID=2019369 RepID=A0A7G5XUM1_9PLAT|nr:NADH dehydrogenase subunit 6 [Syndesmis echinorum]QNA49656.1 NADH dehydrogenase subunit 6 [Syndesmis echinorum]